MKTNLRKVCALLTLVCVLPFLYACSKGKTVVKENVEINYGETYLIQNEELNKYDDLSWQCDNENVAEVSSGTISAVGPGSAVVSAKNDDEVVAEFSVNVKTIPVTSIVLSTNSHELTEGETFQLSYTLFPENASDYGLSWKSADCSVAEVDDKGLITALKPGQTTISISNSDGFIATCSLTVKVKPAYERLSAREKTFVDCFLEHINQFKNPDSVVVKDVQQIGEMWVVRVSAQNGFGGNSSSVYYLDGEYGFWNWESYDIDSDVDIEPDSSFDISLINEALTDKR